MVSTFESIDSSWPGFANSSQKRHKTKGKNARLIQDSMRRNAGKEDDEKEEVILIKTKTRATGGRRRWWWPFLAKIGAGHNCVMIITEKDFSSISVCPRTSSPRSCGHHHFLIKKLRSSWSIGRVSLTNHRGPGQPSGQNQVRRRRSESSLFKDFFSKLFLINHFSDGKKRTRIVL